MDIRAKIYGIEHIDYLGARINLANLYIEKGDLEKGENILLDTKNTFEHRINDKSHQFYFNCILNLGNLNKELGNYKKAEDYYLESKTIRQNVVGKFHPDCGKVLNNLGLLYSEIGEYQKAESYLLEAKEIYQNTVGAEHPYYAAVITNLGLLKGNLGMFEKAENLFENASAIYKTNVGIESTLYAGSLVNLANLYADFGKYDLAEKLYSESKDIFEKLLGNKHPDYAGSLTNLAKLYYDSGKYDKAKELLLEAKLIFENYWGGSHPKNIYLLNALADVYEKIGQTEQADSALLELKKIIQTKFDKKHPFYAANLAKLANLKEKQGRLLESESLLTELCSLEQENISKSAAFLSENELSKYSSKIQMELSNLYKIMFKRSKSDEDIGLLPNLAFNYALFYKGMLQVAAISLRSNSKMTPETDSLFEQIVDFRRRLAIEYSKPIDEQKQVFEIEEKSNLTEKKLSLLLSGYNETFKQIKWQDVQSKLKKDEVALEFVHFNFENETSGEGNLPSSNSTVIYGALLIQAKNKSKSAVNDLQPTFIPLFEEKQFTETLLKNKGPKSMSAFYLTRGAEPVESESSEGLYNLIWKPIESHINKTTRKIYYSPTGILHRVNFDAIPDNITNNSSNSTRTNLSDRYELVRLGSTRVLAMPQKVNYNLNNNVILFGNINYDLDTSLIKHDTVNINLEKAKESGFSLLNMKYQSQEKPWNYLPGTEIELNNINSIFKEKKLNITLYTGNNSTEESFKNIGKKSISPKILHIATHGYFFPDPKANIQILNTNLQEKSVFKISDQPLIRSGLILSGGNYAWIYGKSHDEKMEDGILTAYEISQMNLSNTELVILSACETGLGDIQGNEGVYGLQRAFKIAGAKYLIMSLWQVPDKQTSLLMTTFYKKWLEEKKTIPEAFLAAQKELRDIGLDPYQWAGFVLVE